MNIANATVIATLLACSATPPSWAAKEPLANDTTGLYYKDERGVYLQSPRTCEKIVGCFGGNSYSQLRGADPKTFEILTIGAHTGTVLARDKRHVFYGRELVPNGDPATLQVFGSYDAYKPAVYYAKDRNNIYYNGSLVQGMDVATFEHLGGWLVKDKHGVYFEPGGGRESFPTKADLIDPATFQVFHGQAANPSVASQDVNFTFSTEYRIVDVRTMDPSFKRFGCDYIEFRGNIYYTIYLVQGADPASFRVLPPADGTDLEDCSPGAAADRHGRYSPHAQARSAQSCGSLGMGAHQRAIRTGSSLGWNTARALVRSICRPG
jgi:hypothetical protein